MKKYHLLLPITFAIFLTACGSEKSETAQTPINNGDESLQEIADDDSEISKPTENEENTTLESVGQKITLEGGTIVELKKIKIVDEIIELGPLHLYIKDIKLLNFSNMSDEHEQELLRYADVEKFDGEVNFVQIVYTAENTEDRDINWSGFRKVVLSNRQQITPSGNNISNASIDSDFYGLVKQEGILSLIYNGQPDDITSVKLILWYVGDKETHDKLSKEHQVEYEF